MNSDPDPRAQTYFLITERAGFRAWTPDDLPLALTLWGDPAVMRFIDARRRKITALQLGPSEAVGARSFG